MFSKLIPRSTQFFDFLERHAAITLEAALKLLDGIADHSQAVDSSRIKAFEHEADQITEQCVKALYKTFITPIDREQIHSLIGRMDDIMDRIYGVANYLKIYKMDKVTPDFVELTQILVKAVQEVQEAVKGLRDLGRHETILNACSSIARLEHEADTIFQKALGSLFEEEVDARQIIKWKDLYISLEIATDSCSDVANMIERILLEND